MAAQKARVENERLKNWDDLDDAERADLHEALREGFEDVKAGRSIDAKQWAAQLRARL